MNSATKIVEIYFSCTVCIKDKEKELFILIFNFSVRFLDNDINILYAKSLSCVERYCCSLHALECVCGEDRKCMFTTYHYFCYIYKQYSGFVVVVYESTVEFLYQLLCSDCLYPSRINTVWSRKLSPGDFSHSNVFSSVPQF